MAHARLDAGRMRDDVTALASDRYAGRATGTAGGRLAGDFVAGRFASLGLEPAGDGYAHEFAFDHRSIRALWRRDRPFLQHFAGARNIVGLVRGRTRPEDAIVVSAHYDHLGVRAGDVYHGADDNASGTAALMAIAAYVHDHPLRHTVLFAAFDAEELGLRGAEAFLRAPPVARPRIRLTLNMDMIGRSDDGRLFVAGTAHVPRLRGIVVEGARGAAVPVHLGHDRPTWRTGMVADWTTASDHGAFHAAGIPFLYFGVEDHPDVHAPTDTADRIDAAFLQGAAEAALSTLLVADAADL